jgi:hypothetical protein
MQPVLIALIEHLPAILTAGGVVLGVVFAWRNGKKTDRVEVKADVAAEKATTAATAVAEVHEATKAIASQTNGHLTRLADELARLTAMNEGLQATIVTLTSIIASHAAPATVIAGPPRQVRKTDLESAE